MTDKLDEPLLDKRRAVAAAPLDGVEVKPPKPPVVPVEHIIKLETPIPRQEASMESKETYIACRTHR